MSKKTPKKKSGRRSDISAEDLPAHITPVPVSPQIRSSPGYVHSGQLTGLPRKVKDSCADWHNLILEWDSLNSKGLQCASQIANMKIESGSKEDGEEKCDLSAVLPPGLEKWCQQLKLIYLSMEKIVRKMETLTSHLKGVCDLDRSLHDQSLHSSLSQHRDGTHLNESYLEGEQSSLNRSTFPEPLFQTWPTGQFYEVSEALLKQYSTELVVKLKVLENIAHAKDRPTLMTYTAVWLHQPYIDHMSEQLLHGMLIETGLRAYNLGVNKS